MKFKNSKKIEKIFFIKEVIKNMSFKYPDAVIYRIKCFETLNYYIGSTVDLENRIRIHKQKKFNTNAESIIKTGNYKFKILEKCPCNVYTELFQTEQKYIDIYRGKYDKLVLNKNNPYPTEEQKREKSRKRIAKWKKKNPDADKEFQKIRYHTNKKQINAQRAEKIVCDCGAIISRGYKSTHFGTKKHQKYISKINENKI